MKLLLLFLILLSPEGELKKHVNQFTIKSRNTSSQNIRKAQDYVVKECKSYGLSVKTQGMLIRGKECRNIIAWREGKDKNKIIVIGAHLDTVSGSPGADDNASGSACLLLLAKRFKKPKYTILFQWYTGEEQGLLGSKFYAKYPLFPVDDPDIDKHIFMLNLDMVGRLKMYPGDNIDTILEKLFPKYPFAKGITFREGRHGDHSSFHTMPVVWLFTGTHRDYHRSTDTSAKLNYKGMAIICDYAFEIVTKIMGDKIPDYVLWSLPLKGE